MRLILLIMTFGLCGLAAEPAKIHSSIVLHVHGLNFGDKLDETLTLERTGKSRLDVISEYPVGLAVGAPIGSFELELPTKQFEKILALAEQIETKSMADTQVVPDSLVAALSWKPNEKPFAVWEYRAQPGEAFESLEKMYVDLKQEFTRHPRTALQLTCKKIGNTLDCFLKNVGMEEIKTVDPLDVYDSIVCMSEQGRRFSLNPHGEYDPKRRSPKTVTLGAQAAHAFQISSPMPCQRVLVRNSDMVINASYRDYFLGDFVSNKID